MGIADYIRRYADLPTKPTMMLLSKEEEKLFQTFRQHYQVVSVLLEWLLLGKDLTELGAVQAAAIDPSRLEDILAVMWYILSEAEYSAANLKLAQVIYPRTNNPFLTKFSSPEDLWINLESQFSEEVLSLSGITGRPFFMGKYELTTKMVKAIDLVEFEECPFTAFEEAPAVREDYLLGHLVAEAYSLGKANRKFKLKYFIPYLRAWKRCISRARDTKGIGFSWIDSRTDKIVRTQRHVKLPKRL